MFGTDLRLPVFLARCLRLCLICLLFVSVVSACQSKPTSSHDAALKKATVPYIEPTVITPRTLIIGSYVHYFPQEYIDPTTKKITGFDIELIELLAQRLRLRAKIVPEDFSLLLDGLSFNRFDAVISALTITPELENEVHFIPYFRGGETLLVSKGNPLKLTSLHDLCGYRAAVKDDSFELKELEEINHQCTSIDKSSIKLTIVTSDQEGATLLLKQQVDATYIDTPAADYFLKQHATSLERAGKIIGLNIQGIAVRKGNVQLYTALSRAFDDLKTDGTYRRLIEKWGLYNGDITEIAPSPTQNKP